MILQLVHSACVFVYFHVISQCTRKDSFRYISFEPVLCVGGNKMTNVQVDHACVVTCLDMAAIVYEDHPSTVVSNGFVCITGLYDGQAMISQTSDGRVIIAFRGTESLTDLAISLLRRKIEFPYLPGTKVHTGFFLQYVNMRRQIMNHLKEYHQNPMIPITVTGHSLGGALATLFAVDLAIKRPTAVISCYTFGTPRVGDVKFVEAATTMHNLSIVRINNGTDVITWYPGCGFVHTPDVINLSVDGLRWFDIRKRHSLAMLKSAFVSCE